MEQIVMLVPILFGLMLLVNIFTEVLKKVFTKIPTNALALVLSLAVTIVAMFIWLDIKDITFIWWMILVAIAVAFMVAYAAMFGWDKLQQLITQWDNINRNKR